MSSTINKAELISKLQTLEGLTNEERSNLIGLLRQHKKYGLVWEDKPEDVEERLREEIPVLCEVKEKAVLSDEPDAPNHILIEGDNLEALIALTYTHEGKIDIIYIDPPYNTGNKDFVYNDSFVDTEDSYRHSKWLSFMNKRLKIAKKLLSDKGAIFISIDDNEQAPLKLLCDEIFGGRQEVAHLIWQKRKGGGNDSVFVGTDHEYILVYKKRIETNENKWRIPYDEEYLKRYKFEDEKGRYYYDTLSRPGLNNPIIYDVVCPDGSIIKNGTWQISKDTFDDGVKTGEVDFVKNKNGGYTVMRKVRVPEDGKVFRSIITNVSNKDAADDMERVLGNKKAFSNPKPQVLVHQLLSLPFTSNEYVVLDFFAGSGTTLDATMQLNAEDGGHRKCILVTNNENNICEDVTYERNKRVINGYTTPKGVEVPGLKANTLRYYKTNYIPRERTQNNMRALVAAATDLLCIKEDLYEEQKTFGRFKLKTPLARYFSNGRKHMLIIYREELIDEIAEEIKTLDFGKSRLKVYVFSPGRYAFADNFIEVEDKVELVALPAAIYDAYQKVLPKCKEKLFDEDKVQEKVIQSDLFAGQEEGGEA
jgi:adenine-specific DNA-methyltransferase